MSGRDTFPNDIFNQTFLECFQNTGRCIFDSISLSEIIL